MKFLNSRSILFKINLLILLMAIFMGMISFLNYYYSKQTGGALANLYNDTQLIELSNAANLQSRVEESYTKESKELLRSRERTKMKRIIKSLNAEKIQFNIALRNSLSFFFIIKTRN